MQDRFKFRTYIRDLKFFKYWGWIEDNHYVGLCACGDNQMPELLEKYTNQCTGLRDRHNNLIYEGDIVNVKIDGWEKSYIPMVVVWDRKEWQLKQYNKNFKQNCSACEVKRKQKCQYCSQYFSATGHTNFKDFYNNEVIGNIYENKELLNEI